MKQQLEHQKVIKKTKCMHQMFKKLENFLNSDMVHEMFHTYLMWSQVKNIRSVAQPGSAPGLGPGGPRFESLYSDQYALVVEW